jgi:hypothetical protein
MKTKTYKALLSSDWNECLAPCGPFDAILFHFPEHSVEIETAFRHYTGNKISLAEAVQQIQTLCPEGLTIRQMDAYLKSEFTIYRDVSELISWCRAHAVLLMVNTTGMIGYFQRVLAKRYLPFLPVLAAHPLIRFDQQASDPALVLPLFETADKAVHTAAVAHRYNIRPERIFLMGDSGGDGPHFEWGAKQGAHLIGSMTKPSLQQYCRDRGIRIDHTFGHTYAPGESKSRENEMSYSFMEISEKIKAVIG